MSTRGLLAQWLEHRTHNPAVLGSSPGGPTTFASAVRLLSFALVAVLLAAVAVAVSTMVPENGVRTTASKYAVSKDDTPYA